MSKMSRRAFVGTLAAAAGLTAQIVEAAEEGDPSLAFGNRTHIFAHPKVKERLTWCFSTVLGLGAPKSLTEPGLSEPILAFRFPNGGSLSVEFTEQALNEDQMRFGAWFELWSNDPAALREKILEAGLTQVHYPATNTFYFAAPGGQVVGVVSAHNPSAGQMRVQP